MVLCDNCNLRVAVQKHHVKYFPEEPVPVCDSCHKLIHSGLYPLLTIKYIKYSPGDAKIFYSQNRRIDGFISKLYKRKKN